MKFDSVEFESFVSELLERTNLYRLVQKHAKYKNTEVDIVAEPFDQSMPTKVIEVKLFNSNVGTGLIDQVQAKWANVRSELSNSVPVIVSLSPFTPAAEKKAKTLNIEIWGMEELSQHLNNEQEFDHLFSKYSPYIKAFTRILFYPETLPTKEDVFIDNLKNISPGKVDWSVYQQTIYDIFEHLLCPPLDAPRYELADFDKRNRRDIIFENIAHDGFWKSIKDDYHGNYIVVDAKNYTSPLSKRPIVDIAHYLKPYGCGMFGVIVSRKGMAASGVHARKELWIGSNKMIVVLSDEDIISMLKQKKKYGSPEEIIRKSISTFRMSL
jgi:hypothetical protein